MIIALAFVAGIVVGVTGFMAIIMLGAPEPKPKRRLSTIINTAFLKKPDEPDNV